MNRFELYKQLRRHLKLAAKRDANFEKNRAAKYIAYGLGSFMLLYLMFFAVMFSLIANESTRVSALEFICMTLPFVMLIDFWFRFVAQQTPAQLAKPYSLMPLPRYACIDTFIIASLRSGGNCIWFALILPFAIMSLLFTFGFFITVGFLLFFYLLVLADSQLYAICRALISHHVVWIVLPVIIWGALFTPLWLPLVMGNEITIHDFKIYQSIGEAISMGSLLPLLGVTAVLALLIAINRRIQYQSVWQELSKQEKVTKLKTVSRFAFLDRYGEVGQFIQLEIKTIMRNKNPKKKFIYAVVAVFVMSLVISLTEVYDNQYMTNFWGIYNFMILGGMLLVNIMSNEGNYIDFLMIHKENLLKMLKAKYIFYCALILLPLLLCLPTVIQGKWSLYMLISYAAFTCGVQYFIFFQLAVYNHQTMPLNTKFIGKAGIENNYIQVIAEMICMFVPVILVSLLQNLLSDTWANTIMLLLGLGFMLTSNLWLKNIYRRFMARRYANLEAFRATR